MPTRELFCLVVVFGKGSLVYAGGDKPEEAAAKDEEPKEEATAEPAAAEEPPKEDEPKDEVAPEPASEVPKEAAAESPKEEKEGTQVIPQHINKTVMFGSFHV